MKRSYQHTSGGTNMPLVTTKMFEEDHHPGEDELLASAGYNVRASDMDEVARKIDQLDMMMRFGCSSSVSDSSGNLAFDFGLDFEFLSHLESDIVHYDPSNISNWLESLISEGEASLDRPIQLDTQPIPINTFINNNPVDSPTHVFPTSSSLDHHHTLVYTEPTSSSYDLSAIPGQAICGERENKRLKQQQDSPLPDLTAASPPVPIVIPVPDDVSQQNGIKLVHTLMACAQAVQQHNFKLADSLLTQIGSLAASQAGPMRKVATYFAEALAQRIYSVRPQPSLDSSFSDILHIHFYETCPQLRFGHFTANQAILEAVAESSRVHIIDFSMRQGMQWPALMQALAMRPNGPPSVRLTGIGPPQPDNTDALQQVGWKLAQFAKNLGIEFEYKGFVAHSLADLDASMFGVQPGETVVVNSVFELHQLLARPGAIEKVFSSLEQIKPKIVTIVEQEANHNGSVFFDRFTESLHYYSTLFDSLEGTSITNGEDLELSEIYFGNQIFDIVAREGVDRVERHEYLTQWKKRLDSAGFAPSPLGSNTFQQVSSLLAMLGGGGDIDGGYTVAENIGCLFLGWHNRPLVSSSAWKLK